MSRSLVGLVENQHVGRFAQTGGPAAGGCARRRQRTDWRSARRAGTGSPRGSRSRACRRRCRRKSGSGRDDIDQRRIRIELGAELVEISDVDLGSCDDTGVRFRRESGAQRQFLPAPLGRHADPSPRWMRQNRARPAVDRSDSADMLEFRDRFGRCACRGIELQMTLPRRSRRAWRSARSLSSRCCTRNTPRVRFAPDALWTQDPDSFLRSVGARVGQRLLVQAAVPLRC